MLTATAAHGQRVQFPSTVPDTTPYFSGQAPAIAPRATPAPVWDPYGTGSTQPPALLAPGSPYAGGAAVDPSAGLYIQPDGTVVPPQRFFQDIHFEGTWLAGNGGTEFGVSTLEISASHAFPFFYNAAPILLTPGFAVNYLDGPKTANFGGMPDLPPRVYNAYLDASWKPVLTGWLSADFGARVGVYSDFREVNSDSIRVISRGLAVFTLSPCWQVAIGVIYVDRFGTKLLPAGGVVWTPNPDTRWEVIFPQPKLAQRFTTVGNIEWWWYVGGEWGGGAWTIRRASGAADAFDYNDLRVIGGLQWHNLSITGLSGYFEVGYVFDREIDYVSITPTAKPDDTVMLRMGVAY